MKRFFAFLFCFVSLFGIAQGAGTQPAMFKVMSFNIRLITSGRDKENEWIHRKEAVVLEIRANDPLLLGVQEATWPQMEYLAKELSDYSWIGVGRDDGEKKGEFSAVFYKKASLKVLDSGTFWLSESPEKAGSLGWDAACRRVVSWGKFEFSTETSNTKEFKDLKGKKFLFANTHFDHIGKEARKNSALLIVSRINKMSAGLPVVVSGDFNTTNDTVIYSLLIKKGEKDPGWRDTFDVAKKKDLRHQGTYHMFGKMAEKERPRIDFIFINKGFESELFRICDEQRNGQITSDHSPIVAEIYFADRP